MAGKQDIQALLNRLKSQVKKLDEVINGPDVPKQEAVEILKQLEFTSKEAKAAVDGVPSGLSTQEIVSTVLKKRGQE
jgi:Holliday junction resolvasome RuvABC DNA-binding subunit